MIFSKTLRDSVFFPEDSEFFPEDSQGFLVLFQRSPSSEAAQATRTLSLLQAPFPLRAVDDAIGPSAPEDPRPGIAVVGRTSQVHSGLPERFLGFALSKCPPKLNNLTTPIVYPQQLQLFKIDQQ